MKKIFLLCLLLLGFSKTWGQSATVNTFNGLNSAILAANSFAGDYTITFSGDVVFDMSHTPVALPTWVRPINKPTGRLIIFGANFKLEKFTGGSAGRILEIQAGIVEINNLTITGSDGNNINGGGILNAGTLTLENCTVRNNTLTGTPANGAGIYNTGFLVLRNSTVNNNTINSSSSTFQGAGIYHGGTNLIMEYSTISSNSFTGSASFQGAGLYLGNASFVLDNVTVVRNTNATAGGGFFSAVTGGTIRNSLFLGNFVGISTPDDINYNGGSGTAAAGSGNNLTEAIQATTIAPLFTTLNTIITPITDIVDINLRNNGGVTQTHALVANGGNVAIEGGSTLGYMNDQRGEPFLGNLPDIGAYEYGTFWVTNNNGTSLAGSLGAALAAVNTTFPNAPQNVLNTTLKQVKFNISSPNTITVDFNPVLDLPAKIDATTQTNYSTDTTRRVTIAKGTGNSGVGLNIASSATNSEVYGLNWRGFNTSAIDINANDVTVGTLMAPFDGLNVFQNCGTAIRIMGNNAKIYRNYFGLGADAIYRNAHSTSYDIQIGNGTTNVSNTTIGALAKGNFFAAKFGGITFGSGTLQTYTNTIIAYNSIGTDITNTAIIGNAVGIHTNGDVNILTIQNNVIVNRSAAGIFLNDNSKTVTIENNQIGWQNLLGIATARPNSEGIVIRGGTIPTLGLSTGIDIKNNSIAGNTDNGIFIENSTFQAGAITIQNNIIGLANDASETPLANLSGINAQGEGTINNYLTIKDNVISGNTFNGIIITQPAMPTNPNQPFIITNNKIGIKSNGVTPAANGNGITISPNLAITTGITITANTIAKNNSIGITFGNVQGASHTIRGNFIGTNSTGGTGLGNGGTGLYVTSTCTGLVIGGSSLSTANTISGNSNGIRVDANNVIIQYNYIGTNATGTSLIGNTGTGIVISGTTCTIQKNVVSGNGDAITLQTGANDNTIDSNLIGTTVDGLGVLRNSGVGITIAIGVTGTIIKANTISGNNDGVVAQSPINLAANFIGTNKDGNNFLTGLAMPFPKAINAKGVFLQTGSVGSTFSNNVIADCGNEGIVINVNNITIKGHRIGTNNNGDLAMGNQTGIRIDAGGTNATIGGTFAGEENIISGNGTGIATNITPPLNLNITITANKIGLNSAGTAAIPNTTGINIGAGLANIDIVGNSFAATQTGLITNSGCDIQNNKFGTNVAGTAALTGFTGFNTQAIFITSTATSSSINGNVICGARNSAIKTIAGVVPIMGSAEGILVAADDINITGNNIGLPNDAVGANDIGISFMTGATISQASISGNIISGNKNVGIHLGSTFGTTPNLQIINNAIGMVGTALGDDIGTVATVCGIGIDAGSNNFTISQNTINNCSNVAIAVAGVNNTFTNNKIGVKRDGTATSSRSNGLGMMITGTNNIVTLNTIANNNQTGINIVNSNSNRISQNSIHSNGVTPSFTEKGIDLNLGTAQQGNDGQAAPTIRSVSLNSPTLNDVTITGTFTGIMGRSYNIEFFHTIGATVTAANEVEGKIYLGFTTVAGTGGLQTFSATLKTTPPTIMPTASDYITATAQNTTSGNTSEFSTPILICSTTITGITTQNARTNCQGTLVDVRIAINTTTPLTNPITMQANRFDVDLTGDETYEYTNLSLQSDQTGVFILIPDVRGATFFNTKVLDQAASCTSSGFGTNAIVIQNTTLPRPSIISARVVQPTSCINPNGQLIVKIQNGNIGQFYELSTNGVFGAEATGLVLGQDSTLRITNLSTSAVIGNLEVYQSGNQCFSNTFAFAARMTEPNRNIDTTLVVTIREDEISPNFNTVVSLATSQDSISYRLRNKTNGVFVGQSQVGNRNTLSFNTDTLRQAGTYIYEIVATDIRTGCSRILGKTVSVQVISGILQEELDLLREVYNSTNGNNWTVRWDFSQNINTFIGVSIFGGRVTSILLPNNNLTGTLTPRVLSFRRLRNLDISRNRLDFGSVENNIFGSFTFKYDLQDKINTQIDTTAYADTELALHVVTQGNFNTYQWQKDGQNIPNATNAILFFNALKLTDAGVYTCIIRNSRGTALTLERRAIRVRVNQRAVTALDLTLLRELNVALGGANWKNKWIMDGSVPVAEWYGITMEGDKIKSINLANNNLVGTIPDIIPLTNNILSDLIYLNLSGNKITGNIPKSLGNLSKLQYLDISDNLLRGEVIAELGKLTDLNTLWIAKNSFTTIHPDLGKLQNLENLFAHFNLFTSIPNELGGLVSLKKMNFNDNLLKNIPATFGNLVNLENLSLANNVITDLPNTFGGLGKLQELYLQNNQLAALPSSFISLRSLAVFNLHTNLLDFADFEPLANLPVLNADGATYEPQIKVGTTQEILFTLDQKLDFTQAVNGNANTYQWFKNGVMVSGATSLQFLRNFINLGDAGTYTLQIKNTIARKLTLLSRDIVVTISCGNSSSVNINVGGTSRYCEDETINTLLTANITTGVNVAGYQWLRGNAVLANETQKTLSIIQAGDYKLQVRDNNGCVFLSPVMKIEVLKKPVVVVSRVGDSLRAVVSNAMGKISFAWYQNNTLMSAEKTQGILAKASGLYYVVATDEQNCPSKSAAINFVVTGIEDELSAKTVIYPNPSSIQITVSIPDNFAPKNVKLYNLLGQEQIIVIENNLTDNKLMLNIENLASGVYQLELVNQKGEKIRKKVVKQ